MALAQRIHLPGGDQPVERIGADGVQHREARQSNPSARWGQLEESSIPGMTVANCPEGQYTM
jgi:hypothetical protein